MIGQDKMTISIEDCVFANNHKATVKLIENDRYLVHYEDGKGSDWMPLECLKKCEDI
jgi:hypothetical protein